MPLPAREQRTEEDTRYAELAAAADVALAQTLAGLVVRQAGVRAAVATERTMLGAGETDPLALLETPSGNRSATQDTQPAPRAPEAPTAPDEGAAGTPARDAGNDADALPAPAPKAGSAQGKEPPAAETTPSAPEVAPQEGSAWRASEGSATRPGPSGSTGEGTRPWWLQGAQAPGIAAVRSTPAARAGTPPTGEVGTNAAPAQGSRPAGIPVAGGTAEDSPLATGHEGSRDGSQSQPSPSVARARGASAPSTFVAPVAPPSAAAAADATVASPGPIRAAVRAQALEAIRVALASGRREISLTLEPEQLGRLEIRVRQVGDRLVARLAAERPEVGALLAADREAIQTLLAEQGVRLHELIIATPEGSSPGGLAEAGQEGFSGATGESPEHADHPASAAPGAPPPRSAQEAPPRDGESPGRRTGIDLRV